MSNASRGALPPATAHTGTGDHRQQHPELSSSTSSYRRRMSASQTHPYGQPRAQSPFVEQQASRRPFSGNGSYYEDNDMSKTGRLNDSNNHSGFPPRAPQVNEDIRVRTIGIKCRCQRLEWFLNYFFFLNIWGLI